MMRTGLEAARAASRAASGVEIGPVAVRWMSEADAIDATDRKREMVLSSMERQVGSNHAWPSSLFLTSLWQLIRAASDALW